MPSNKDILEAQRYNRLRLVTAFISGTPEGRELEPKSHIRPLYVGVALVLVLLLVGFILGKFAPRLPANWENNTMLLVSDSGARYYTIDGVLRPVTNITSARLLTDSGKYQVSEVDAATLEGIPRGSMIGIAEAPDSVPNPEALQSDRWNACAAVSGATHLWIGTEPDELTGATTAVVSNQDNKYLIMDGRRYLIAPELELALGIEAAAVHPVEASWLNLFERGSDLKRLSVKDQGKATENLPARLATAVVGSVIEVEEGAAQRRYVISSPSQITPLTDVAYRLYQVGGGETAGNPLTATVAELSEADVNTGGVYPSDWPKQLGETIADDQVPCAQLQLKDGTAVAALAQMPANENKSKEKKNSVTVAGGSGALIQTSSGGTLGALQLVTDAGMAHGLGDDPADTIARLGYSTDDVTVIPGAWAALVPSGETLSAEAAWNTVKKQ